MKLHVKNFRGMKSAHIELDSVTIIGGKNAAGKSSIAMALQVALSGEPLPIAGLRKSDAGLLVMAGTGKGSIELIASEEDRRTIEYPQAKVSTKGNPPGASTFALGLQDLTRMSAKEAAPILSKYLKTDPTHDEVIRAIKDLNLKDVAENYAETIWNSIRDNGWDGAHQLQQSSGARLKGQWQGITSENYGSAKAPQWRPQHWETGLESFSVETLEAEVIQCREFVEAAVASSAVSNERRAELTALASKLDAAKKALFDSKTAEEVARQKQSDERERGRTLRRPGHPERTAQCPHCDQPIVVGSAGALSKPKPVDAEADAAAAAALETHTAELLELTKTLDAASSARASAAAALKAASDASAALANLPTSTTTAAELDAAREELTRAERRLAAFRAKREADSIHAAIVASAQVTEVIAPGGLRLTALRAGVDGFNATIAELAEIAGWSPAVLETDLSFTYNGRSLPMLSESERFRVSTLVRFAMARHDTSEALIVDAADILDGTGRNGLIALAIGIKIPVLVCLTINRDKLPSAKRLGDGARVYWLTDATSDVVE